jgi:RHS repeat-associated protein
MAVTDAAGDPAERYEYADYGRPEFFDASGESVFGSQIGNPYLFTGREFDPETGWYYFRTRYLDPQAGRYTTRDTIGIWRDPTSLGNGYTYGGNGPWSGTDPFGEDWCGILHPFSKERRENCRREHDTGSPTATGGGSAYSGNSWGECVAWLSESANDWIEVNWNCAAGTFLANGTIVTVKSYNTFGVHIGWTTVAGTGRWKICWDRTMTPLTSTCNGGTNRPVAMTNAPPYRVGRELNSDRLQRNKNYRIQIYHVFADSIETKIGQVLGRTRR